MNTTICKMMAAAVFCLLFSSATFSEEMKWEGCRQYNSIMGDIQAHYHDTYDYTTDDDAGTVHETTHGIHAWLENNYNNYSWVYVLNDKAFRFKIRNVKTLSQIANATPAKLRTSTYKLYLVDQQRYFNDDPAYVTNEWAAYRNGTLMAIKEYGPNASRTTYSYKQMNEMYGFMLILAKLEGENEDLKQLLDFAYKESIRIGKMLNQ